MTDKDLTKARLDTLLSPSNRIYVNEGQVKKLRRKVKVYVASLDMVGKPYIADITSLVAFLMQEKLKDGALVFDGWGYSAAHRVADKLSEILDRKISYENIS
jgi:hypothetical protein